MSRVVRLLFPACCLTQSTNLVSPARMFRRRLRLYCPAYWPICSACALTIRACSDWKRRTLGICVFGLHEFEIQLGSLIPKTISNLRQPTNWWPEELTLFICSSRSFHNSIETATRNHVGRLALVTSATRPLQSHIN